MSVTFDLPENECKFVQANVRLTYVGIYGPKHSGKDTIADEMMRHLRPQHVDVYKAGAAQVLYDSARDLLELWRQRLSDHSATINPATQIFKEQFEPLDIKGNVITMCSEVRGRAPLIAISDALLKPMYGEMGVAAFNASIIVNNALRLANKVKHQKVVGNMPHDFKATVVFLDPNAGFLQEQEFIRDCVRAIGGRYCNIEMDRANYGYSEDDTRRGLDLDVLKPEKSYTACMPEQAVQAEFTATALSCVKHLELI